MLWTGQICLLKPEFAITELDDIVNMDFVQISDSLICGMVVYETNKDNRTLMKQLVFLACRRLILLSLSVTLNMCGLGGGSNIKDQNAKGSEFQRFFRVIRTSKLKRSECQKSLCRKEHWKSEKLDFWNSGLFWRHR
jgi:hypothetical protein